MRKLIYAMSVSIDGYIEDANADLSWSIVDEELHRHWNQQEDALGMFLYGRRMYELMASYWPTADQDPAAPPYIVEYARIWKSKPKVVFSTTLERVEWNARLVRDNIAPEVKRLKEQPGGDLSVSGPGLAASFMQLGLIDEYQLYVNPVVLGGGKPMVPRGQGRLNLTFVETRAFQSGVVLLRYRTAAGHP